MDRRNIACRAGLAGALVLALLGCGDGDSTEDIGQAGDKARATRVIDVAQLDSHRFEPDSLSVKPEETVTVRITNKGTQIHELFLGDEAAHKARNAEMKAMGTEPMTMRDEANAVTVDPGASKELTWTFPKKGTVQFGCHQPGHYGDGMKGTVTVA